MKMLKTLSLTFLMLLGFSAAAQISSYEEMEFEMDSTKNSYRPYKKNFAYVKSKKGTGGVARVAKADSILEVRILEIVLVFTETTPDALESREESNRERWENLFETYPEFFQHNGTTLKNVCQCNMQGDAEVLKQTQGFYIYFDGPEPKSAPVAAAPPPPAPEKPAPVKETKPADSKPQKTEIAKTEPARAEPVKEEPVKTEPAKKAEPEPVVAAKEETKPVRTEEAESEEPAAAPAKPTRAKPVAGGSKRAGYEKPRKARDPKACRQPCYEGGDEDLVAYFKNSLKLTKKQKKKAKKASIMVNIQLNYDGTVKKATVQGEDAGLTAAVQSAVDGMGPWNPAVKNGVTVKSTVKFFLKFDKSTKTLRPSDFVIAPRPGNKCPCVSDAEMFGN